MDSHPAPDGGWGYACVIGTFQSQMLFGLAVRSFGVLYLLTLERFQTTATVVSWVGATNVLAWGAFSPLASMICHKFGCRTLAAFGSILQFAGFLLSAFSSHIAMLYVGFGLLVGSGVSFTAFSGYVIVSMYFHKKRAMATAVASTGSSFSVFCMPPLVNFLAEYYGYQGCLLILAGMSLQGLVSAALFRPLPTSSLGIKHISTKDKKEADMSRDIQLIENNNKTEQRSRTEYPETPEEDTSKSLKSADEDNVNVEDREVVDQRVPNNEVDADETAEKAIKGDDNSKKGNKDNSDKWCGLQQKIQLLRDEPVVAGIVLANFTATVMSSTFSTFTPALAKEQGYPQSLAVLLISFGGISDIIARISFGFLMDSRCLKPRRLWFYCSCGVIGSLSVLVFPLIPYFAWYSVWAVVHCSVIGTIFGQRTTVIADILGVKRMAPVFGLVQLVNSLGFTVGIGIGGVLRDQLETYAYNYYIAGIVSLFGFGCLITILGYMQRFSQATRKQKNSFR